MQRQAGFHGIVCCLTQSLPCCLQNAILAWSPLTTTQIFGIPDKLQHRNTSNLTICYLSFRPGPKPSCLKCNRLKVARDPHSTSFRYISIKGHLGKGFLQKVRGRSRLLSALEDSNCNYSLHVVPVPLFSSWIDRIKALVLALPGRCWMTRQLWMRPLTSEITQGFLFLK